jgi:beta-lactamase class A
MSAFFPQPNDAQKFEADLVVNANVHTLDARHPAAEAVAVFGNRIAAVGTNEEIRRLAGARTRVVDAGGALVLLGFNDSHVHFLSGGFQLSSVDLRDAATPQEFAERIRRFAANLPKGRWITGGDWDHERWPNVNGSAPLPTPASQPVASPRLQKIVDDATRATLERFKEKGLTEKNLAVTLVDLTDPRRTEQASFRGAEPVYPASVVKLFYLVAAHRWMEDGRLKETEEIDRALHDMIVDSLNDPAHFILDALTGVSNGAELPPAELKEWAERRNAVNRYFASLGYTGINVNQKPWCEGPYGRERQFYGPHFENRNRLTTDATARLLAEIVSGRAVSPARSARMLELLKRDFSGESKDPDDQAHNFTGLALEPGMRLWSKAGWTDATRHDAAYIELPGGRRIILVTFTTDFAKERDIIPTIARSVIKEVTEKP